MRSIVDYFEESNLLRLTADSHIEYCMVGMHEDFSVFYYNTAVTLIMQDFLKTCQ